MTLAGAHSPPRKRRGHFFGRAAFVSASPPVALATWALERTVGLAYRDVEAIAVSESTAEELTGLGMRPERIAVVHNGVDDRLLSTVPLGLRDVEPTVLYLGRLERYKRVDLLIRAIARVRDSGDAARLIIAGDGRQASTLRRLVRRLGLTDRARARIELCRIRSGNRPPSRRGICA